MIHTITTQAYTGEPGLGCWAAVNERLGDDGQARVHDGRLVDVEHKLRILDHVHPEPQHQAGGIKVKQGY